MATDTNPAAPTHTTLAGAAGTHQWERRTFVITGPDAVRVDTRTGFNGRKFGAGFGTDTMSKVEARELWTELLADGFTRSEVAA